MITAICMFDRRNWNQVSIYVDSDIRVISIGDLILIFIYLTNVEINEQYKSLSCANSLLKT